MATHPPTGTRTPAARGFTLPAEWEPHAATWLSWPNARGASFPGPHTQAILPTFHKLVAELADAGERVILNLSDPVERQAIERALPGSLLSAISLELVPTNEPWCRDHGPTVLRRPADGCRLAVCWNYNAWGGKYPPWDLDAAANERMAANAGIETCVKRDLIIEGGSLESNGAGCLMISESSVVTQSRNPGRTRDELASELRDYTGADEIIWVRAELPGDDTDGHVDCFARFAPGNGLLVVEPTPEQAGALPALAKNAQRLRRLCGERGWTFLGLPLPDPVHDSGAGAREPGDRLPATYANYYVANEAVLVPGFDDRRDAEAAAIIGEAHPGRRVVTLPARDLIWGRGGFHCLTQSLPA